MAETLAAAHGRTAPRAPLTGGGGGLTERLDRVASRLAGGGLPLSLARA